MFLNLVFVYTKQLLVFLDLNECQDLPCVHGSCKDGINDYNCICNSGYTGKDCEIGKC